MSNKIEYPCPECNNKMTKQIGVGYFASKGFKPTVADLKELEHSKKVKDPERAVKMRQKTFGQDAVGDPKMEADPKHVVKRGRTLGGQQKEVDKKEIIKALAKDDVAVNAANMALKKERNRK